MQFSKLARGGTSIYIGILGLGFQMGWVGLAQNTKSGSAKIFSGIKMLLRNSSERRTERNRVRTNGRLSD
jgi:hypothetical protein